MHVQLVEDINTRLSGMVEERGRLQKHLNEYLKDKTFVAVKNVYKTPYSSSGTNFKGRKCKLSATLLDNYAMFYPTFQNMRTGNFDMRVAYCYSPECFELLESEDADVQS